MDKQQAIDVISGLYPADSQFEQTNAIGKQMMLESIEEANFNWRNLPEEVLVIWAQKAQVKEQAETYRVIQKYK